MSEPTLSSVASDTDTSLSRIRQVFAGLLALLALAAWVSVGVWLFFSVSLYWFFVSMMFLPALAILTIHGLVQQVVQPQPDPAQTPHPQSSQENTPQD